MPRIDLVMETMISRSPRAKQLEALFDVPPTERSKVEWHGDLPIESEPWNVGLIVGPSGSGKSLTLRKVFGEAPELEWERLAVVDDFDQRFKMEEIAEVCSAVGFNTIPAWLRPFSVLSNGEKFRVEMARRLLETDGTISPIIVDEFTSVVDRQVAKIGAHAVQKYVRRTNKRFVAASCHYDIVDWLQPDWILEPATMNFQRRRLRRRPSLDVAIRRVQHSAWNLFAPFHYLTKDLHRAARCYALFVEDRIASFAGNLHRPHPKVDDIMGCSRLVTLPDWQGLGLAMILVGKLGAAYRGIGKRFRTYPAHPDLIRSFDRSPEWELKKKPGLQSVSGNRVKAKSGQIATVPSANVFGDRPCAVFEYSGPAMDSMTAKRLLDV